MVFVHIKLTLKEIKVHELNADFKNRVNFIAR